MANRKITVVGDGAEESLTPEEEHKIEVKIDKMLDLNQPDEPIETTADAAPPLPEPDSSPEPKSKVTKIITKFADEPEVADEPAAIQQSAPPLAKKPAKKITVTEHKKKVDSLANDNSDAEVSEPPKAKVTRIITKFADEPMSEPAADEKVDVKSASPDLDAIEAAALAAEAHLESSKAAADQLEAPAVDDESIPDDAQTAEPVEESTESVVPETPEPKKIITTSADDTTNEAEERALTAPELPTEPAVPPQTEPPKPAKPDPLPGLRPIAFPRAVPAPTEVIVDDLTSPSTASDPLSAEDAAIAHAFETKPASRGLQVGEVFGAIFSGKALRILLILIVLAAIITPFAVPKVRTKLVHYVQNIHGSHAAKPAQTSTTPTVAAKPAATQKEVYVAKQSGTYNVYQADVDGQNQKLLLAGTGNEQADGLVLTTNSLGTATALVSAREKATSSAASPVSLNIIDIATAKATAIDQADQVKIIDWFGSRIVYALIKTSTSSADTSRYQLVSYDTKTKQRTVLDHASYLNDVMSAHGAVYYATSSQLMKILPDGSGKQVLLDREVWRIYRTDYNNLALATATTWYTYKLGDTAPATTNSPYAGKSRLYIDSSDGKHSLWVDVQNGKNVLVNYTVTTGKDTVLSTQSSLNYPLRWLGNDTIAYRVKSSAETADYTVTTSASTPKKAADVIPTAGIALWFND